MFIFMFLCYAVLAAEEPQIALNYLRDALQKFDEQQQKNMAKQIEHIANAIILNKESETFTFPFEIDKDVIEEIRNRFGYDLKRDKTASKFVYTLTKKQKANILVGFLAFIGTFAVCLLFLMTLPISLPILMLLCLLK